MNTLRYLAHTGAIPISAGCYAAQVCPCGLTPGLNGKAGVPLVRKEGQMHKKVLVLACVIAVTVGIIGKAYAEEHKPEGNGLASDSQSHKHGE